MLRPNANIFQPQFGGYNPGSVITFSSNSPVPASNIEKTMFWLDRIAEQHDWVNKYSTDPLIMTSGFVWKRHNGLELEDFVPNSGHPYELLGYPTSVTSFWEHFRNIIKFVGKRTLRKYDSYGGYISGAISNGLDNSGWRWGPIDTQWSTYGYFNGTNDTSALLTSGIVDLNEASHTRYMGLGGKLDSSDYSQYINVAQQSQRSSLDYFELTAEKEASAFNGCSDFFAPLYDFPSGYAYFSPYVYHYISGVLDKTPSPTELICGYGGVYNSGYAKWRRHLLPGAPLTSGYKLHDYQITTNNQAYAQSDFSEICDNIINQLGVDTESWTFSSDSRICEMSFHKDNRMVISEKNVQFLYDQDVTIGGGLGYMNEFFKIKTSLNISIPITFLYMSREVQSPISGDIDFIDYNHYLREFTGFTPNDSLDIRSLVNQYESTYSSGIFRPISYSDEPLYETDYTVLQSSLYPDIIDAVWAVSGHEEHYLDITSNGPVNLVYGYVNYNPFDRLGPSSGTPFYPQTGDSTYYRNYLGQKAINSIYAGNYTSIGSLSITSGTVSNILSYNGGLIDAFAFTEKCFKDNQAENYQTMIGTIQNIVDLTPSGNMMFFALLPGDIHVSSLIKNNDTIPTYSWSLDNHDPDEYQPYFDQDRLRYLKHEIIRTKASFDNAHNYGLAPTDSQPTSFYAIPSGSRKIDHTLSAGLTIAANTNLYNSHL
jgi:hypothetical protein